MKQEKMDNWNYRSDVTDEIAINMQKRPFSWSSCKFLFIYLF